MTKKLLSFFILLLAFDGCVQPNPYEVSSTDEIIAFDNASRIKLAAQYSREQDHAALLIYQGDQLVYEEYGGGASVTTAHAIFSGTKSFSCAIAVQAQTDGYFATLDDLASATITEWATDPLKSQISIRHLLNMTSGLDQSLATFLLSSGNKLTAAVNQRALYTPGSRFEYGEVNVTAFSEIMRRKLAGATGENALQYLRRTVFAPIGLSYSSWVTDLVGNPMMSFGALITAREWAKYGILLKNDGEWDAVPILDPVLLDECFVGSAAMPGYGLTAWLNSGVGNFDFASLIMIAGGQPTFSLGGRSGMLYNNGPADLVALAGIGNSRIYYSATRDFVIVRLGRGNSLSDFKDARFLGRYLEGRKF